MPVRIENSELAVRTGTVKGFSETVGRRHKEKNVISVAFPNTQ